MTTFYMVQMDFPFPEERANFDTFYDERITMLLSIDGFLSAQRFEASSSVPAPFLAIYEIVGPEVLTGPGYASKAGPAAVPYAYSSKFRNWNRNLFAAPTCDLTVPLDRWLTVIDRLSSTSMNLPTEYVVLIPIGLDRNIVERGVRIHRNSEPTGPTISAGEETGWQVRTMKPLHAVKTSDNDARWV